MDLFDYMREQNMEKESPLAATYYRKGQAVISCHLSR